MRPAWATSARLGSGNIGATNVLRTGNKTIAAATLLLDALKGAAAVLIAHALADRNIALLAGLAAVIGHLFPVWLRFKGGKGVATGLGVLIAAAGRSAWAPARSGCSSRHSPGFPRWRLWPPLPPPPCSALIFDNFSVVKLAFTIAVLVFVRHQANIRRLLAGTEPRIGQGKGDSGAEGNAGAV